MKIVKIICDRCGCEIEGNPYRITIGRVDRQDGDTADYISTPEYDFCGECVKAIVAGMIPAKEPEPEAEPEETEKTPTPQPEETPESEPVATETTKTTETTTKTTEATHKPPRKGWITKDDAEEITKRYKAGEDMLKIADDLNLMRPQVSRFIAAGKLWQERYKGKTVPSNGSAPIPTCELGRSVGGGMSDWR